MAIRTVPELYAHAIAIEREAAGRYAELAARMADEGRPDLARTFDFMAREEASHLQTLEDRTRGVSLPAVPAGQYRWMSEESPESVSRELFFNLMTPRSALKVARLAELKALAFFEGVLMTCEDPGLRALAREMAAEEQRHVAMLEQMLERSAPPGFASIPAFSR